MKSTQTIERLISPVSVSRFIDEYFGKRPLYIKGAPRKFDFLLKSADFKYGLDRVDEIRCVFPELRQATIGPWDIKEMFDAGASICVTGAEKAHTALQTAAEAIQREIGFGGTVDFRTYLSPPRAGFDIHFDARIATSLQIDGSKTWWFTNEPHESFPTSNSPRNNLTSIRRAAKKLRFRRITLQPGDLLCLPAGVWHYAKAGVGGSLALNMAFNYKDATVLDLVLSHIRESLQIQTIGNGHFISGATQRSSDLTNFELQSCLDAIRAECEHLSENPDFDRELYDFLLDNP